MAKAQQSKETAEERYTRKQEQRERKKLARQAAEKASNAPPSRSEASSSRLPSEGKGDVSSKSHHTSSSSRKRKHKKKVKDQEGGSNRDRERGRSVSRARSVERGRSASRARSVDTSRSKSRSRKEDRSKRSKSKSRRYSSSSDDDSSDSASESEEESDSSVSSSSRGYPAKRVKREDKQRKETVVTFLSQSSGAQFERILDSSLHLSNAREQVRSKFAFTPSTYFRLSSQSSIGGSILLEDEEDFRAFRARALRSGAESTVVYVETAQPQLPVQTPALQQAPATAPPAVPAAAASMSPPSRSIPFIAGHSMPFVHGKTNPALPADLSMPPPLSSTPLSGQKRKRGPNKATLAAQQAASSSSTLPAAAGTAYADASSSNRALSPTSGKKRGRPAGSKNKASPTVAAAAGASSPTTPPVPTANPPQPPAATSPPQGKTIAPASSPPPVKPSEETTAKPAKAKKSKADKQKEISEQDKPDTEQQARADESNVNAEEPAKGQKKSKKKSKDTEATTAATEGPLASSEAAEKQGTDQHSKESAKDGFDETEEAPANDRSHSADTTKPKTTRKRLTAPPLTTDQHFIDELRKKKWPCRVCEQQPYHPALSCSALLDGGMQFAKKRHAELSGLKHRKKDSEKLAMKDLEAWIEREGSKGKTQEGQEKTKTQSAGEKAVNKRSPSSSSSSDTTSSSSEEESSDEQESNAVRAAPPSSPPPSTPATGASTTSSATTTDESSSEQANAAPAQQPSSIEQTQPESTALEPAAQADVAETTATSPQVNGSSPPAEAPSTSQQSNGRSKIRRLAVESSSSDEPEGARFTPAVPSHSNDLADQQVEDSIDELASQTLVPSQDNAIVPQAGTSESAAQQQGPSDTSAAGSSSPRSREEHAKQMQRLEAQHEKEKSNCETVRGKVAELKDRQEAGEKLDAAARARFARGKAALIRKSTELEAIENEMSDYSSKFGVSRPPRAAELDSALALSRTLQEQPAKSGRRGRAAAKAASPPQTAASATAGPSTSPEEVDEPAVGRRTRGPSRRAGSTSVQPASEDEAEAVSRTGPVPMQRRIPDTQDVRDPTGQAGSPSQESAFDPSKTPGLRASSEGGSEDDVATSPMLESLSSSQVVPAAMTSTNGQVDGDVPEVNLPPSATASPSKSRGPKDKGQSVRTTGALAEDADDEDSAAEMTARAASPRNPMKGNAATLSPQRKKNDLFLGMTQTQASQSQAPQAEPASSPPNGNSNGDNASQPDPSQAPVMKGPRQPIRSSSSSDSGSETSADSEDEEQQDGDDSSSSSAEEQQEGEEDSEEIDEIESTQIATEPEDTSMTDGTNGAAYYGSDGNQASESSATQSRDSSIDSTNSLRREETEPIGTYSNDAAPPSSGRYATVQPKSAKAAATPPASQQQQSLGPRLASNLFSSLNFFQSGRGNASPSSSQPLPTTNGSSSAHRRFGSLGGGLDSAFDQSASQPMANTSTSRRSKRIPLMPRLSELDASVLKSRAAPAAASVGSGSEAGSVRPSRPSTQPQQTRKGASNGGNNAGSDSEDDAAAAIESDESSSSSSDEDSDDEARSSKKKPKATASKGVLPASKRADAFLVQERKKKKARGLADLF